MGMSGKWSIFGELWYFLRFRKKWWLAPILLILLLMGAFIVLAETSAIVPFIYSIF